MEDGGGIVGRGREAKDEDEDDESGRVEKRGMGWTR